MGKVRWSIIDHSLCLKLLVILLPWSMGIDRNGMGGREPISSIPYVLCLCQIYQRTVCLLNIASIIDKFTWRHHQMETISVLLALCAGNSPVTGEFPTQRPVTRSFDVFFDLRLNKRLSKQSWGWWFEMPSRSFWCHSNVDAAMWIWIGCVACMEFENKIYRQ